MNLLRLFLLAFLFSFSEIIFAQDIVNDGFAPSPNLKVTQVRYDGTSILIAGSFTNLTTSRGLARLQNDGTVDLNFNNGGVGINVNGSVDVMVVLPNGQIAIGGNFTTYNGVSRRRIALLNANGTLDPNFGGTGFAGGTLATMEYQQVNGVDYLLVGGFFSEYNGVNLNGVSRNLIRIRVSDGIRDTNFHPNPDGIVTALLVLPDNNILVGGDFFAIGGNNSAFRFSKIDPAGVDITSFAGGYLGLPLQLLLGSNNHLYVAGTDGLMAKDLNTGADIVGFVAPNLGGANTPRSMVEVDGDALIIGGDFGQNVPGYTYSSNLSRIDMFTGAIDDDFNGTNYGPAGAVFSLTINSEQSRVLVGGEFQDFNGEGQYANLFELVYQPLPLKWLYFEAQKNSSKKLELTWGTSYEYNTDKFLVEESFNGTDFKVVGEVSASGFSQSRRDYSWKGPKASDKKTFFRIRQQDTDGKFSYSDIQAVHADLIEIISFYPNPSTDKVNVELVFPKEVSIHAYIIDTKGTVVFHKQFSFEKGSTSLAFDISAFKEGLYLLRLVTQDGKFETQKQILRSEG